MIAQHAPALIPMVYLVAAMLIPIAGSVRAASAFYIALLGGIAAFWISWTGLLHVISVGPISYHLAGWPPPIGIELVLDPLSAFMAVVVSAIGAVAILYSKRSVAAELPDKAMPFYCLSMVLLGGLMGMTMTGDLFNLYVFLEIAALAGYALVAIGDRRASISAFRYLVLGAAGGGFYLLGVGFLFASIGTLNIVDIGLILHAAPELEQHPAVIVGFILMVVGIALKMGLFPIHHWLPDAYTYASSPAAALIAPIGTKVAVYVLIRLLGLMEVPSLLEVLSWVAAAGIFAASVMAVAQTNIKRMLGYSSVANIGYITLGITLANPLALTGALLHVLNHALMKLVLFFAAGGMLQKLGTVDILRLRGFPTVMPLTATAFLIAAFSMVGIPPTGGFFSKLYLVLGAIEAGAWFFVAVIIASSLLALAYSFFVVRIAFFKPYEDTDADPYEALPRDEMAPGMLLPMLAASIAIILVGLFNGVIVESVIGLAVTDLLGPGPGTLP
jgi:multicomponent Na+:H+ antiporter subunit D